MEICVADFQMIPIPPLRGVITFLLEDRLGFRMVPKDSDFNIKMTVKQTNKKNRIFFP